VWRAARLIRTLAAALWLALPGAAAGAAESCPGFVAQAPARVVPAAVRPAALQADEVRLTVRNEVDDAASGAPGGVRVSTLNAGYGLTGMRERLRMLNGTLEAGREGTCWVVTAQVPLSTSS